jgi:zinc protease
MARHADMHDVRVNEPRLERRYVAPSVKDGASENAIPLSVFAQYLGGGDSSVLYNTLVRDQKLATSISVSFDPMSIGPALFHISATPANGVSLHDLEIALDATLANVLKGPLDLAATKRAKTLLKADIIYAQDGLQPLANVMADLYAIGLDEQYFYAWSDSIDAVTDETALAAARTVIVPKAAVTGYLLTEEAPAAPNTTTSTEAPHAP